MKVSPGRASDWPWHLTPISGGMALDCSFLMHDFLGYLDTYGIVMQHVNHILDGCTLHQTNAFLE